MFELVWRSDVAQWKSGRLEIGGWLVRAIPGDTLSVPQAKHLIHCFKYLFNMFLKGFPLEATLETRKVAT